MKSDAICVLLNGLLSVALGLVVLLAVFRLLSKHIGILVQFGVFVAALGAVTLCNALWWKLSLIQLQGVVPWLALILFWGGLVYFYLIHFETIVRDGGPTYILFRFIDDSPSATRTRQDILDHFCGQTVLSERIETLVATGWLKRTAAGCYVVTGRSRLVLFFVNGWSQLLGYPWGG